MSELTPYAGNARVHKKQQIKKLADQISTIDWINPIIIDEGGMILSGHGRYQAAIYADLATVPTITVDGLSEAEKRSHILADNRLSDESTFSKEQLKIELAGLVELGDNLEFTGFDTLGSGPIDVSVAI